MHFSQFQALLERPVANLEEALERVELINAFVNDFVEAATPFVKTVVEEEHLPDAQRTINPINIGTLFLRIPFSIPCNAKIFHLFIQSTGGIAGGMLLFISDIFFLSH